MYGNPVINNKRVPYCVSIAQICPRVTLAPALEKEDILHAIRFGKSFVAILIVCINLNIFLYKASLFPVHRP